MLEFPSVMLNKYSLQKKKGYLDKAKNNNKINVYFVDTRAKSFSTFNTSNISLLFSLKIVSKNKIYKNCIRSFIKFTSIKINCIFNFLN